MLTKYHVKRMLFGFLAYICGFIALAGFVMSLISIFALGVAKNDFEVNSAAISVLIFFVIAASFALIAIKIEASLQNKDKK